MIGYLVRVVFENLLYIYKVVKQDKKKRDDLFMVYINYFYKFI